MQHSETALHHQTGGKNTQIFQIYKEEATYK